jgi:uncharacterized protein YejL (UPF0352 family)
VFGFKANQHEALAEKLAKKVCHSIYKESVWVLGLQREALAETLAKKSAKALTTSLVFGF